MSNQKLTKKRFFTLSCGVLMIAAAIGIYLKNNKSNLDADGPWVATADIQIPEPLFTTPNAERCTRPEPETTPTQVVKRQITPEMQQQCLRNMTEVEEIERKAAKQNLAVYRLDTRPQTEGILMAEVTRAQPRSLLTQDFLKKQPVLLIGNGKTDALQLESCQFLRDEGFQQVYVLQHGVRSWIAGERRYQAEPGSLDQLYRITGQELFALSMLEPLPYQWAESVTQAEAITATGILPILKDKTAYPQARKQSFVVFDGDLQDMEKAEQMWARQRESAQRGLPRLGCGDRS